MSKDRHGAVDECAKFQQCLPCALALVYTVAWATYSTPSFNLIQVYQREIEAISKAVSVNFWDAEIKYKKVQKSRDIVHLNEQCVYIKD